MNVRKLHITTCIITCLAFVTSPGQAEQEPDRQQIPAPIAVIASSDNCRLALTQPSVNAREISAEQIRLRTIQDRSVASLEKLGWAYLSAPQSRYHSELVYLAGRIAECLAESSPNSDQAKLLSVKVDHENHRFADAEATALELVDRRGSWFDYAVLGDVLVEQGKIEQATDAYQAMVDLKPGPQAYTRVAHIRWLGGQLDDAMEMMALAIKATSTRDRNGATWTRSKLAEYLFQAGQHRMAIAVAEQALEFNWSHAPSLYIKGRALLDLGDRVEGVNALRAAVDSLPQPEYQWALIEALENSGQNDDANGLRKTLIKTGQQLDPRSYALFLSSVGIHRATALDLATREIGKRQDPLTLDVAAWASLQSGNQALARRYIERALSSGIRHPRIDFHAAMILDRAGESGRASDLATSANRSSHFLMPSERRQLEQLLTSPGGLQDAYFQQPTYKD